MVFVGGSQSVNSLIDDFKKSKFVSNLTDFDENWLAEFVNVMGSMSGTLKEDLSVILSKKNFLSNLDSFLKV